MPGFDPHTEQPSARSSTRGGDERQHGGSMTQGGVTDREVSVQGLAHRASRLQVQGQVGEDLHGRGLALTSNTGEHTGDTDEDCWPRAGYTAAGADILPTSRPPYR